MRYYRVLGVLRSTNYHYALRGPEQTTIEKDDKLFQPVIRKILKTSRDGLREKDSIHHGGSWIYYQLKTHYPLHERDGTCLYICTKGDLI